MDMQNYTTPFAITGDREEFSIDTDPSGKVSLEKGWTELYQLRPEEGGLFILRKVFNQMMKLVSTDTVTWKTQSFPNWIDDKGDGLPYSYPKNAIVKHTDGNTYVSKVDNNTSIPTGANWKLFNILDFVKLSDFTGVNQSLSGSGYQKLPGGLIIQWGYNDGVALGNNTVIFPVAFPNACLFTMATPRGNVSNTSRHPISNGKTTTTATFYVGNTEDNSAANGPFDWLAIGY